MKLLIKIKSSWSENSLFWLTFILSIGIAAVSLIATGTRWGGALFPDSGSYLEASRNFLAGKGLQVSNDLGELHLLRHYPPLYPVFLGLIGYLAGDSLLASVWLVQITFALCVLLTIWIAYLLFDDSLFARLVGVVFLFAPVMLFAFLNVLSEPLFIFLELFGALLLLLFLRSEKERFLLGAAICFGLGSMTRFIGISLVPFLVCTLLLDKRSGWPQRFWRCFYSTGVAILPVVLWSLWTLRESGTLAERTLGLKAIPWIKIETALSSFSELIIPSGVRVGWVGFGILLLLFASMITRLRRVSGTASLAVNDLWLLGATTYIFSYLLFLLFSLSLVDAGIPLDRRILSPLSICIRCYP